MLLACSDFLATARDKNRCHLCHCDRRAHPTDFDRAYWASWLVFHVLLELQ